MKPLSGKTALVTGAARGLGEAIAIELAAQGAKVALLDVLEDLGGQVADEITKSGGVCYYRNCDIRETDAVSSAVDEAYQRFGRLDVLVNNAAVSSVPTSLPELAEETWNNIFNVNVASIYRFCRFALPRMQADGGGSIINMSSVHQSHSLTGWTAYAATKGAIISMSRQLAAEWGRYNIRVNTVSPGAIDATMTRQILDRDPTGQQEAAFRHMHALERLGKSEEIGKTVAFLASDGAGFITGEDILVDGGLTKLCRL